MALLPHIMSQVSVPPPDVAESVDMSKPMYSDRLDTPLPDRPYKDELTAADQGLKQKERGPWGQLTKEEKIARRFQETRRLWGTREQMMTQLPVHSVPAHVPPDLPGDEAAHRRVEDGDWGDVLLSGLHRPGGPLADGLR